MVAIRLSVLAPTMLLLAAACLSFAGEAKDYYYALEQNGVVSGYAHATISQTELDGRPTVLLIDSLWKFTDDFMAERNQPGQQERKGL